MRTVQWKKILTLAFVAGIAAACETGTEPMEGPTFDAEAALEDHQALDTLLTSKVMDGFRAMAKGVTFGSFGAEVGFAAQAATELHLLEDSTGPRTFAGRIAELATGADFEPHQNPIISSFRRGRTFVYDASLGRYVMDPDRPGAPKTGVRFILYEPGEDGRPNPEVEVGYADLIDEGDQSAEEIALRLVVVEGEATVLDYSTTVDVLDDGAKITVDGFLQGEHDRLDFDIAIQGSSDGMDSSMDVIGSRIS